MDDNPHANILAVAANDVAFLKQNIPEVVDEERAVGNKNVHYAYFLSNFTQVNNGHPGVEGHQIIANRILEAIDTIDAWNTVC